MPSFCHVEPRLMYIHTCSLCACVCTCICACVYMCHRSVERGLFGQRKAKDSRLGLKMIIVHDKIQCRCHYEANYFVQWILSERRRERMKKVGKRRKRRGEGRRGGPVKMDADWSNVFTSHVWGPQELENTVRMLLGAFSWSTALLTPWPLTSSPRICEGRDFYVLHNRIISHLSEQPQGIHWKLNCSQSPGRGDWGCLNMS